MRMLHAADWHLCDRLGRIDRTTDLQRRVEAVAGLCEEHAADVLLLAGDLFSEQARVEQMTAALEHLGRTFAGFFARGGTILGVTGNHDHDGRINMVRAGMALAAPPAGRAGPLARGRMYLLNGTYLATLEDASGGKVQFALVPYPTVSRYGRDGDVYHSREEENRLLQARVAEWLAGVPRRGGYDPRLPTVLAAHLHVRGAEVHTLYKLTERDDVIFEPAALLGGWAYVALGHIHKPQAISGAAHVRYCGSLDRLDFGERDQERGVLLVDVGPQGLRGEPEWLPIEPTPFLDLTIDDPAAQLPLLAGREGRAEAIVRATVDPRGGVMSRDEIARELRRLFPRLHELRWAGTAAPPAAGAAAAFAPRADFASTVRDYLEERLKDDPDREALLELASRYMREGGQA